MISTPSTDVYSADEIARAAGVPEASVIAAVVETSGRPQKGTFVDSLRTSTEPLYVIPLYILGLAGLFFVPRAFAALAVLLLAYQTAVAMIFVGVTRYRVPWDFLLCVLAAATVLEVVRRARESGFVGGARQVAGER